jgi:hypothetical protein
MNSPTPETDETARLEKLRTQLSTDIEAIQQKEVSLREYEQRLRLLVEQSQGNPPPANGGQFYVSTGPSRASLDAEWEKYERANALLEAARRSLTDDRLVLKERDEKLMIREQEVSRREAWVKAREQQLAASQLPTPATKAKGARSAAPFRGIFSRGKSR